MDGLAALNEKLMAEPAVQTRETQKKEVSEKIVINSEAGEAGAAHIVSAAFVGVRSEVLLHALEEKGIYVSAGSACSSNKKLPVSPVLKELGLPQEVMEATLRFSFSRFTTEEEIDYTLQVLEELLPVLSRYARY